MAGPESIPFQQVVEALLNPDTPLHPRFLFRLSDLEPSELAVLEKAWPGVPVWRRQALLEDIEELGEKDYVLSFEAIGRFALRDSDPIVRKFAVRTLWEYESDDLIPIYLDMVETDDDTEVRAAVATALGKYIYLGEIEELSVKKLRMVEEKLLELATSADKTLVRRRALEALGFSSRDEVPPLIEQAYNSRHVDWLVSALFAMGRSANQRWNGMVLAKLESDDPEVRMEAVRAAGELEAQEAVPRLIELLEDVDEDVRLAAIWSLSQIGGEGVRELLEEQYDEAEDEDEAQLIESALDNLDFTEDVQLFSLMDVSESQDLLEDDYADVDDEEDSDATTKGNGI